MHLTKPVDIDRLKRAVADLVTGGPIPCPRENQTNGVNSLFT
jgi:hypothetical protein